MQYDSKLRQYLMQYDSKLRQYLMQYDSKLRRYLNPSKSSFFTAVIYHEK